MSSWVEAKSKIKNIETLKKALKRIFKKDVDLKEKAKARGYSGNQYDCDYVLKLKGGYDVGFTKQADGTYSVATDQYELNNHCPELRGKAADAISQAYNVESLREEAMKNGYDIYSETQEENGDIKLELESYEE